MISDSDNASYSVLASPSPVTSRLDIKRSRFICFLYRVETEQESRAHIESLRTQYYDARHVCSAFMLGPRRQIQRSSDDGEPAGTAGIPILQTLLGSRIPDDRGQERADLSDICAVVVRYFGGIKLGAGGLVHAYTDTVVHALEAARFKTRRRLRTGDICVSFAEAGKLENDIRTAGLQVKDTTYTDRSACITLGVCDSAPSMSEAQRKLAEITAGQLTISWGSTLWDG